MSDVNESVTVHALRFGYALCQFSTEVPGKWPEGNKWVYVTDLDDINCKGCKTEAMKLHEPKQ